MPMSCLEELVVSQSNVFFAISSLLLKYMGGFGILRTVLPTQTLKQTTDQVDAVRDCYGCPFFYGHTLSNAFTVCHLVLRGLAAVKMSYEVSRTE